MSNRPYTRDDLLSQLADTSHGNEFSDAWGKMIKNPRDAFRLLFKNQATGVFAQPTGQDPSVPRPEDSL